MRCNVVTSAHLAKPKKMKHITVMMQYTPNDIPAAGETESATNVAYPPAQHTENHNKSVSMSCGQNEMPHQNSSHQLPWLLTAQSESTQSSTSALLFSDACGIAKLMAARHYKI